MIERLLQSQLEPVARRQRQLRLWRSLAACWAVTALAGVVFLWSSSSFSLDRRFALIAIAVIALGGFTASLLYVRRCRRDYRQIARQIEREHPDLHSLLITAVEQQPDPKTCQFNYLQARVIREAILEVQARKLIAFEPGGSLRLAQVAHLCALAVAMTIVAMLATTERPGAGILATRGATALASVEPGDVSVEKGTALFVMARFSGPPPASATLVIAEDGQEPRRLSLERTLADPVFGGSIPEVNSALSYAVEYSGNRTRDYRVKVFEYPKL
ncbi:MAG: hypothetical protein L0Y58_00340, partial [Verrucomicrobia subdivision 3 bacterium]|nr:hypothetical protein [Limisphaerales bacterium]